MKISHAKNIFVGCIKKYKVAILLSMVLFQLIYDSFDFGKRAAGPIAEYIKSNNIQSFDELTNSFANKDESAEKLVDALTKEFMRSSAIRTLCPLCSSTDDDTK